MSSTLDGPTQSAAVGPDRPPSSAEPRTGDSFVPLRKDELVELLARQAQFDDAAAARFRRLAVLIEVVFHQEFHARQEQLKRLYAPFDPDSDSRPVQSGGAGTRWEMLEEFLGGMVSVLEAANFRPLADSELDRALSGSTQWGLDLIINREIFDRLMIFVRGNSTLTRMRADLSTRFRLREFELEVYDRLVLVVKLRAADKPTGEIDVDNVYIKLFRDIPKLDLEMLLPGTRPRIRLIDAGKIGGSSVTGLYGLFKLFMTTIFGKFTWAMIAIGAFSYALQTFVGYKRTKANYQFSMTQQLYYQNLDNNAGVFCRVIDEAEDEETKEAILAYFFLWQRPGEAWTPDRLGDVAEKFLREQTGDACEFQSREAISKLERLGLLCQDSDELRVLDPQQSCQRLGERAAAFLGAVQNS